MKFNAFEALKSVQRRQLVAGRMKGFFNPETGEFDMQFNVYTQLLNAGATFESGFGPGEANIFLTGNSRFNGGPGACQGTAVVIDQTNGDVDYSNYPLLEYCAMCEVEVRFEEIGGCECVVTEYIPFIVEPIGLEVITPQEVTCDGVNPVVLDPFDDPGTGSTWDYSNTITTIINNGGNGTLQLNTPSQGLTTYTPDPSDPTTFSITLAYQHTGTPNCPPTEITYNLMCMPMNDCPGYELTSPLEAETVCNNCSITVNGISAGSPGEANWQAVLSNGDLILSATHNGAGTLVTNSSNGNITYTPPSNGSEAGQVIQITAVYEDADTGCQETVIINITVSTVTPPPPVTAANTSITYNQCDAWTVFDLTTLVTNCSGSASFAILAENANGPVTLSGAGNSLLTLSPLNETGDIQVTYEVTCSNGDDTGIVTIQITNPTKTVGSICGGAPQFTISQSCWPQFGGFDANGVRDFNCFMDGQAANWPTNTFYNSQFYFPINTNAKGAICATSSGCLYMKRELGQANARTRLRAITGGPCDTAGGWLQLGMTYGFHICFDIINNGHDFTNTDWWNVFEIWQSAATGGQPLEIHLNGNKAGGPAWDVYLQTAGTNIVGTIPYNGFGCYCLDVEIHADNTVGGSGYAKTWINGALVLDAPVGSQTMQVDNQGGGPVGGIPHLAQIYSTTPGGTIEACWSSIEWGKI